MDPVLKWLLTADFAVATALPTPAATTLVPSNAFYPRVVWLKAPMAA